MKNDMSKLSDRNTVNAFLRLFNAVPIAALTINGQKVELKRALQNHFVVMTTDGQVVVQNLPKAVFDQITVLYGYNTHAFNQAFHKSFERVDKMDPVQYYLEQILHYFSTYGMESFGLKAAPYIPLEHLELPATSNDKGIRVIWALSSNECVEMVEKYLKITQRPSTADVELTIPYLMPLAAGIDPKDIASFEIKCQWYAHFKKVPESGTDWLRYVIYKLTGSTLLIKSDELIRMIKACGTEVRRAEFVKNAFASANLVELAAIFLRFKPLFLALKTCNGCAPYVNKIRRMANVYHKPLPDVNVQNLSKLWKEGRMEDVDKILAKASVRNLIKLANFATVQTCAGEDPVAFNIRNGKTFVKKGDNTSAVDANRLALKIVTEMVMRFDGKLKDKVFLLPSYMKYAAPYSEKQMVDTIPWGSYIPMASDNGYSFGIHWVNQGTPMNEERIDLDLHMSGLMGNSIGWCAGFRSHYNDEKVVYSGDMTSAPIDRGGATESMFVKNLQDVYSVSVNRYCGGDRPLFKVFMAPHQLNRDYIVDMSDVLFAPIKLNFAQGQSAMTLGLMDKTGFYFFSGTTSFHRRVPVRNLTAEFIQSVMNKVKNQLSFETILRLAGATIIESDGVGTRTIVEGQEVSGDLEEVLAVIGKTSDDVISLLPEELNATSFFDILDELEVD